MNIILNIDNLNPNQIFYQNPVKNTIMEHSNFIRLIYSTDYFVLNNLLIEVVFNISSITKYFEKYIYNFESCKNKEIIQKILKIEESILSRIKLPNKKPIYRISNQLSSNNIKLYTTTNKTNATNAANKTN